MPEKPTTPAPPSVDPEESNPISATGPVPAAAPAVRSLRLEDGSGTASAGNAQPDPRQSDGTDSDMPGNGEGKPSSATGLAFTIEGRLWSLRISGGNGQYLAHDDGTGTSIEGTAQPDPHQGGGADADQPVKGGGKLADVTGLTISLERGCLKVSLSW
ncbi:MAG TPA: hypothetical protein VF017_18625 [Thermoanaerobaculia bacterium]|nr:hypothetical protein [Thermoanaerobaculia bacterium]